ncbi:MAG: hypothetical protein ABSB19_17020 [Methylomonas sp.]|jgi:hypothetical protein
MWLTSPGNHATNYGRDAAGNINNINEQDSQINLNLVSLIQTNALGRVAQQNFANGYSSNNSYNSDGQLSGEAEAATPKTSVAVPVPTGPLPCSPPVCRFCLCGAANTPSRIQTCC